MLKESKVLDTSVSEVSLTKNNPTALMLLAQSIHASVHTCVSFLPAVLIPFRMYISSFNKSNILLHIIKTKFFQKVY